MDNYFALLLFLTITHHQFGQSYSENGANDVIPQDNCQVGFYRCKNGACINESLLCDRKQDCQDNDDEEGCVFVKGEDPRPCAKTNGRCYCDRDYTSEITLNCTEASLVSIPKLINKDLIREIYITGNKIPNLPSGIFTGLKKLESLVLRNNEIATFESDTFAVLGIETWLGKVENIDLTGNNITKLTSKMFERLQSANNVLLGRNRISAIENDAFNHLAVEESLDLSGNQLQTLVPGMFDGIFHTNTLNLQDNKIDSIENCTFCQQRIRITGNCSFCETLVYVLNLSGNKITQVTTGMFGGLNLLNELYLQDNEIDTIENNSFHFLNRLIILDLHSNKLTTLKPEMFNSLRPQLYSINLRNNAISTIERRTFDGLTYLSILDLSRNKLTKLEAYTFQGNKKLQQLLLSENEISHIEPATFNALTDLKILNLSSNPLHTVDKDLFINNYYMNLLLVDDLQICCQTKKRDCNLQTSDSHFCADHTIAYISGGVFFIVIIIVVIVVLKKYFSRQTYKTTNNEGPDEL